MRGEVKKALKNVHPPRPNLSKREKEALDRLRKDKSRVILTVDKGVSMVVMIGMTIIPRLKSCYTNQPTDPSQMTPPIR